MDNVQKFSLSIPLTWKKSLFWLLLGLVVLGGMWALWVSTPLGLGLVNDSVAYIGGARSLLDGNGYRRVWTYDNAPITHFPPLYSLVLAAIGLTGFEVIDIAHWLALLLYGLNAVLAGAAVWRITHSRFFAWLAALLFVGNATLLRVHAMAMSEPLFLFLSLLFFLCLDLYFEQSRLRWLVAAGALAALAFLTRYSGLALLATVMPALLLLQRGWRRIMTSWVVLSASALPGMAAWLIRNQVLAGSASNRQLIWHPVTADKIQAGIDNLWGWLLPGRALDLLHKMGIASSFLLLLAGAGLLGWLVLVWVRFRRSSRQDLTASSQAVQPGFALLFSTILYIFVYLAAMLFSMSLFDASTSFESRILAPVFVSILIGLVAFFSWLWDTHQRWLRVLAGLGVIAFTALFLVKQAYTIESMRYDSPGFASRVWQESQTIDVIRHMTEGTVLYTNRPTALYILTDRPAYPLPSPFDPVIQEQRTTYLDDLNRMREEIRQGRAVMVFLGSGWADNEADKKWYQELTTGLNLAAKYPDGEIYSAGP